MATEGEHFQTPLDHVYHFTKGPLVACTVEKEFHVPMCAGFYAFVLFYAGDE